jgi:quercetin dioxygenase-like cupin family protein
MAILRWNEIEREQMNPLLARQVVHGANMTVARLEIGKGAVVPLHHHVNEQITMMLEGKLRFVIDGVESVISAGEVMVIPPNAPHMVEALEDSAVFDLFSPLRSDWLSGDDAYLRK